MNGHSAPTPKKRKQKYSFSTNDSDLQGYSGLYSDNIRLGTLGGFRDICAV